ncbi:TonB-dependent receptor [Chryseolinea lacunae]|uniref:Outer membrane beta-barrel protein n=1 Tax=Chryseolinea lacunae TaxID=2801331 RepID=A0ABS1L4M7_9BACT|nr:outer membrane beta-barrel protein [Chryseolinea lacunae]MBL0745521.1 outer membrane beta-barrel protein [Chryseolinea lacunae]
MFTLKDVAPAHYLLVARMVGFKTSTIALQVTNGKLVIDPMVLEEESTVLGEVVVEADKPLFEQRIDRLIVNVDNSIASAGGSVLDVLERSPGITVNRQSGGMSMNGKSGIQVMLNGKLQRLPLSTVIQQLEGVSAGSVDKIELISNPSSRYDAEGDAGIINIVTKKNTDEGLHGTATVGLGFSDVSGYVKPTGSTTLHYKRNDVALQASYSMNSDRRWQQWNYERQLLNRDLYSNTITDRYVTWPIQRFSAGADWSVTKQTSMNVFVSGFSDLWKMESFNHSRVAQNGTDSAHIALHDREVNHWKHGMANFNLSHVFTNGSKLNIDADYLYYHDHNPNHFVNDYTFSATNTHRQDQMRISKETPIHMLVLKADYEWKMKALKIEVGAKSTLSELKNDVKLETLQGETWVPDSKFTQAYSLRDNAHTYKYNMIKVSTRTKQMQICIPIASRDEATRYRKSILHLLSKIEVDNCDDAMRESVINAYKLLFHFTNTTR